MNELALFAGAGGGILGGKLIGWRTVCAVEKNPRCQRILLARQNDGSLPAFPIWDDISTFDGRQWSGIVDVVSGGFPCQDISNAGTKAGILGNKSGLWVEMARIIREVRPSYVIVENSATLFIRGLDRILLDLAKMGFDAKWGVLGAFHAGLDHRRERTWIVAHARSHEQLQPERNFFKFGRRSIDRRSAIDRVLASGGILRGDDGMAGRVDGLGAVGQGQVPAVVAAAWSTLSCF